MNKKSWLIVGLSLAMAASIGVGISACGGDKNPDTPEHTHTYDAWDYNETQHWKYCDEHGSDKSNIDETTKANHDFKDGKCECGATEGQEIPDADLDTRRFWVVGSGAGDLKNCSFTELKSSFELTKQPKKDENGYTVYKTAALTLYAGDTMKIVQDLDWDEGLGYFGVSNIKNNDGSLVDGGGPGNITPAKGKDGKYIFTVRTKADIAFSACTLEFELVEPVEPLKNTEEIYIVGTLYRYTTQWPKNGSVDGCLKLNYDEATGEWSITLRLGGKKENNQSVTDAFKLYNSVNGKYFPDGTGNNWEVSGSTDGKYHKESGDYKISWKTGDFDVTFTLLPHEHNFDDNRIARDDEGHFTACWLDDTEKEGTRQNHDWENDQDTKCDTCGYTRHVHTYDQWGKNETQHWKQCAADSAIDESTRQDHTFDQPDNKCVCGQEQGAEACKHEGKINFSYTADNVPALQEEGGTLKGTCAECSEEVEITYDKIGTITTAPKDPMLGKPSITLENDHTYYLDNKPNDSQVSAYVGYKIEAAGTLTLRANVIDINGYAKGNALQLKLLCFSSSENGPSFSYAETNAADQLLVVGTQAGKWNTASKGYAKWKEQMTFTPEMNEKTKVVFQSMTMTFKEEDVGKYVYMVVGVMNTLSGSPNGMKFLIDTTFSPTAAGASSIAPQEVAMLPGKED